MFLLGERSGFFGIPAAPQDFLGIMLSVFWTAFGFVVTRARERVSFGFFGTVLGDAFLLSSDIRLLVLASGINSFFRRAVPLCIEHSFSSSCLHTCRLISADF